VREGEHAQLRGALAVDNYTVGAGGGGESLCLLVAVAGPRRRCRGGFVGCGGYVGGCGGDCSSSSSSSSRFIQHGPNTEHCSQNYPSAHESIVPSFWTPTLRLDELFALRTSIKSLRGSKKGGN
jgi:hypothetical protein